MAFPLPALLARYSISSSVNPTLILYWALVTISFDVVRLNEAKSYLPFTTPIAAATTPFEAQMVPHSTGRSNE
jgi:hypothetical protein